MDNSRDFKFRQNLFDFPAEAFRHHIQVPGNNRIVFSGKFGIGKSYFLDAFFSPLVQAKTMGNSKYEAFHIFPVNYSIASSEDIFRYIKYDVISTMLSKEIKLQDSDFSFIDTLPSYLKGNLLKVLATLIYMIPKLGKDVYESYEKLEELKDDFIKHHTTVTEQDGDKLISFLEKIENKEGSIFENDVITKLIKQIVERIKTESGKEAVLVIDDLDRIDPDHVFRILNVFAAHLDNPGNVVNKLGFDKIILVCDINNLRNIFQTKFGGKSDFNGYIDKFYSYEVYHFDNRKILQDISIEAFKSVKITGDNRDVRLSWLFRKNTLAIDLCRMLIANGMISLRSLINKINNALEIDISEYLVINQKIYLSTTEVPFLTHFKILKTIIGDYEILKEYLDRIPIKAYSIDRIDYHSNILLYFVHIEITYEQQDDVALDINTRELYLKFNGRLPDLLDNLIAYGRGIGKTQHPAQYKYTMQEFKSLLFDFIDLMKKIDN